MKRVVSGAEAAPPACQLELHAIHAQKTLRLNAQVCDPFRVHFFLIVFLQLLKNLKIIIVYFSGGKMQIT